MMNCPFCKSSNTMLVTNSQQKTWGYCANCGGAGPKCETAEEATKQFDINQQRQSTLDRILGRNKP